MRYDGVTKYMIFHIKGLSHGSSCNEGDFVRPFRLEYEQSIK